jgi:MoaA/NifB/PqqE/SkfB family radical SAM enzyme
MILERLSVLVLHTNNRCNCRCTMCSIWKSTERTQLTPERLRGYVPDMQALGVEWVVLTGGEPLMNPHCAELCTILRDIGVRVTVLTTGLLLPRFAEMLVRLTDEVIVSLDGPREVHERIRRVVGAFDGLAAGVRALHEAAPEFPVSGRCTVQRANCAKLCATVEAAREIGLKSISFLAADVESTAFNREGGLTVVEAEPIALGVEDLGALDREIEALDLANGFVVESREKLRRIALHFRARLGMGVEVAPRCNAPWVSGVIETDGTMRPCFFHETIGKADSGGFAGALNGEAGVRFRAGLRVEENEVCRRCVCSLWRGEAVSGQRTAFS